MTLIEQIQEQLDAGFTKSDLERLIGLPKNSLTEILKGKRSLSKKSEIKIKNFILSDKPNPLTLPKVSVKDLNKPTNTLKPVVKGEDKSNYSINTTKKEMPSGLDRISQMRWIRENG